MTVSGIAELVTYSGNGSNTGPYGYAFDYFDDDEFIVKVGGIEQTLTTQYTVTSTGTDSLGKNTGANINFITAPPSGTNNITIRRRTKLTQDSNYSATTSINTTEFEIAQDRSTMKVQDAMVQSDEVITIGTDQVVAAATPLTVSAATPLVQANIQPSVDAAAASAAAALVSENAAAADVLLTAADVVSTNADVVLTNADVVSTNADVVTTNANVIAAQLAETNAETAETNAETAQTASETARDKAQEWATKAEDDPVETGPDQYSSLHWARKAEEQKDALTGALTGNLMSWQDQVGSGSPVKGARLRIDSSDDSTVISLASTPDGDTEYDFTEADGVNWTDHPWTLNPSGNNINGVSGNRTITARNPFKIVWKGATDGYEIQYYVQEGDQFQDQTGNFTALNGGKYNIDEGATVTIEKVVASFKCQLKPKVGQDLFSFPATLGRSSTDTFFDGETTYGFDDNATLEISSTDGSTIGVEVIGVSHRDG